MTIEWKQGPEQIPGELMFHEEIALGDLEASRRIAEELAEMRHDIRLLWDELARRGDREYRFGPDPKNHRPYR